MGRLNLNPVTQTCEWPGTPLWLFSEVRAVLQVTEALTCEAVLLLKPRVFMTLIWL